MSNDQPANQAKAIVPSDTADARWRSLYVGVVGNLAVQTADGQVTTFVEVVGWVPVMVVKVMATGTTATAIVGLA